MRAVIFERFGEPAEVLSVRDVPIPEPGPGEVRVRMIASPVNPSDLLVVRGRYGVLPQLPATPGFEGVGIVDKAGPGLLGRLVLGKRVAAINSAGGNWAEYAVIPARQARPVPESIPDAQAASFFVNPATALAMVRHVLGVPRGAWLAQSAANSNLGKMIIRLARHDGIRTVNLVRREAVRAELLALGADAVIATEHAPPDAPLAEWIAAQLAQAIGPATLAHALDPVGGAIGSGLFRALGPNGLLLAYGSLSEEPLAIPSRALIAGPRTLTGFWLGHFMRSRTIPANLRLFRQIGRLIESGILATETGPAFDLAEVAAAARAAEDGTGRGKVLLRISHP